MKTLRFKEGLTVACARRERTGYCNHSQCPYTNETDYECVEIIEGCCEAGDGCLEKCHYSFESAQS